MKNKIRLSSGALDDLNESFDWYSNQSEKSGKLFISFIDESMRLILLNPEGYPQKHKTYREFVLSTFPYIIVYEYIKEERVIFILHIFHTGRNPKLKYRRK